MSLYSKKYRKDNIEQLILNAKKYYQLNKNKFKQKKNKKQGNKTKI